MEIYAIHYIEMVNFEVRAAAKWCAHHGLKGYVGDPLPDLLSTRAAIHIEADRPSFRRLVASFSQVTQ